MKIDRITPVFVEFIPDDVEQGRLYISETYQTVIHKCCCGCGEEVVTPLSPVDWQLRKGVHGVSLHPSIGNWNYRCQSHYIISNNKVIWAGKFTPQQILAVQRKDKNAKQMYIASKNKQQASSAPVSSSLLSKIWMFVKSILGGKDS
ncbi:DUF6527 family protein [Aeromonas salmonicida]|uniref:DUF6527 family protein n=1 Tax=Aeromonas salmonicida TaxID=645 RepID=UPI00283AAA62|nr:DUF6527 family protein [Aeromonas salmonicida]